MSLELREITCIRGERVLFRDLSFTLQPGEALVLRGSNGSGKSSLLRIVATLLKPVSGQVLWRGEDISEDPGEHRRRLRYIGHLDALKNALTVKENLLAWAEIQGGDEHMTGPAMEAIGIGQLRNLPVQYLSAGQRRRTALGRLLLAPAPIWLLDEPTVALDDNGIEQLRRVVVRHRGQGGIVIAATHVDLGFEGAATLRLSRA